MFYLGLDIAKKKVDAHLVSDRQEWSGTFDNNAKGFKQLRNWLSKRGADDLHACMEATGRYGEELATFLYQQGYQVSMVNAKAIHHYAESQMRRNKTDQQDAALLARYVQNEQPALWQPLADEETVLRALTRRLESLQESHTAEVNRLQAGTHPPQVEASLTATIAFLQAQIELVKTQIQEHIDQFPDMDHKRQLLSSIKGIGTHTAAILIAELPQRNEFTSPKQMAAFAGLTPRQMQSGQSHKRRGLTKMGSSRLRAALYFPAISAMSHNPLVKPLAERLRAKGLHGMAIIGAAMRKLIHLVYGVLKHNKPFDPNHLLKTPDPA